MDIEFLPHDRLHRLGESATHPIEPRCGALAAARREALLDAARCVVQTHALAPTAGVTAPQSRVVVRRVLAAQVESALQLLVLVRAAWRQQAWALAAEPPPIWRT